MPPLGLRELAGLVEARARERAAHVAEQHALEHRLGDRGAVDGDERLRGAPAVEVDRVRDELLAGAALAGDEHRRVGVRDVLDAALDLEPVRRQPLDEERPALIAGRAVELGAAQELRGRRGERLELGDVRVRERTGLARGHGQHADRLALVDDRHRGDREDVEEVARVARVAGRVVDEARRVGLVAVHRDAVAPAVAARLEQRARDVHGHPLDDVEVDREALALGVPQEDRAVARAGAREREVHHAALELLDGGGVELLVGGVEVTQHLLHRINRSW